MPYCVLLMLQFWIVLLLLPVPRLDVLMVLLPEPTPNSVCVFPLPTRLTFLTVLLVAASAPPVVWSQTSAEEVPALVFVIVRSRDDVPALDPSIVMKSAPFRTINPLALVPVIAAVTPVAGLIVIVLVELAPGT